MYIKVRDIECRLVKVNLKNKKTEHKEKYYLVCQDEAGFKYYVNLDKNSFLLEENKDLEDELIFKEWFSRQKINPGNVIREINRLLIEYEKKEDEIYRQIQIELNKRGEIDISRVFSRV